MKKWMFLLMGALFVVSCQQQAAEKTGFVNMQKLTDGYQKLNDLKAVFKAREAAFHKKYDSIGRAFQQKYNDFLARAQKMPKAKADKLYQQLVYEQQQIGARQQQEYQQIQEEASKQTNELLDSLKQKIADYGKENGYTYIFSQSEFNGVLYGDTAKDLTQKLLDRLNGGAEKPAAKEAKAGKDKK